MSVDLIYAIHGKVLDSVIFVRPVILVLPLLVVVMMVLVGMVA